MHSNNLSYSTSGRAMTVLVIVLMLVSIVPLLPAQGSGPGYLVFRDSVPIGPDLDVSFHVVVPASASVSDADLHLFGTQGVMPVSADTVPGGSHNHTLTEAGLHSHGLLMSEGHDHTMTPSGEHSHTVTCYAAHVDTDDAQMSVNLPPHTHTFNGASRIVNPYDFDPVTSNGHNHTVPAHSHNTLMGQGGDHSHVTDLGGNHTHVVNASGDHFHLADVTGDHNHTLAPGWAVVNDGVRPSQLNISVTTGSGTADVMGSLGMAGSDWSEMVDVTSFLGTGVSRVDIRSATHGNLEYVLVVEIDQMYGVISGHGALGPEGYLHVPVWAPSSTVNATAYLFGGDLPMLALMADTAGNHTHVALAAGDHAHPVQEAPGHTHVVGGGDHAHEGYASSATPGTTSTTPVWDLSSHRHDLTWSGNTLVGMGSYSYGRVHSNDHDHQVVDHEHSVTINVSGAHVHDIDTTDVHGHLDGPEGLHTHLTSESADHSHGLLFSPTSVATGGPTGVTAKLDDVDVTDASGGPWDLSDAPSSLDVAPASWVDPHILSLTSATEGAVEWVVLVELADPMIMVSAQGVAGDILQHVPVPTTVAGARIGVAGSPYVLPFAEVTGLGGTHGHTTTIDGEHSHDASMAGEHSHDLALGGLHIHGLVLNDTVVTVQDANATVDLGPHTHTAPLGSQTSSANGVTSVTGTHAHGTEPHVHDLNFTTPGTHVHVASLEGNHTHVEEVNGSHTHTMEGGEHSHSLQPGVHHDASYPSPLDVTVQLGETHQGVNLEGDGVHWWEEFTVDGVDLRPLTVETLSASAGQLGSLSFVIWMLLDVEPPAVTLETAPDWVAPGEDFAVVVGLPEDVQVSSVVLEIGPVTVNDQSYNASDGTIEFDCTAPPDANEAAYDIDLTAADNVGNQATTTLGTLGIDGTPPVVTMTIGEPRVEGQGLVWVTSGTPVNMTIEDATSGPEALEYAFDAAGPWTEYDPANNTVFDGRFEGESTLFVRGVDIAGNWAETQSIDVNIDDTGLAVFIQVLPSVPGDTANEVVASPGSVVSFLVHNDVGVPGGTIYYQIDGQYLEPIREYDRPFPVSSVDVDSTGIFTITWYGTDLLGNIADGYEELTVEINPVAPVPSPEDDLFLPTYVTESPQTLQGNIPGNVARFHYSVDGGPSLVVDVSPYEDFSFNVTLQEGPNTLLYALESPVGVMSQWVVGGVVTLDTLEPEVSSMSPSQGSRDLRTDGLSVSVHFSEPVTNVVVTAQVNGKDQAVSVEKQPGETSLIITFADELPGNAVVELAMTFEDMAGNAGSEEWSYKTRTPSAEQDINSLLLGLVVGFIIGMTLVFLATFRRKEPSAIVHEGGVTTTSIIPPEEDMSWRDEEEDEGDEDIPEEDEGDEDIPEEVEEEAPEEAPEGPGPEEEVEEEEETYIEDMEISASMDNETVEEGTVDEGPEPEPDIDLPEDWEEGDVPGEEVGEAPEPTEEEVEETPEPTDEQVEEAPEASEDASDLEDEIDRLLDEATSGDQKEAKDLPDPDDPTVDPGSRF